MVTSEIARLDLGELDPDAYNHRWLFSRGDPEREGPPKTDRIEATMVLRDFLDSRPPTSATFTTSDVVDYAEKTGRDEITTYWFIPEIMWLCDCWRVPPHYNDGGGRYTRWINPQYAHREQFSPVTVECECGGIVTAIKGHGSDFGVPTEHEDDCYPGWRNHAAGVLMENRRIMLTRLALLGKSGRANNDLFHCKKNHVSKYVATSGADAEGMKKIGLKQRRNTLVDLIREGYSTREAARVYDLSPQHVRDIIADKTHYDLSELKP